MPKTQISEAEALDIIENLDPSTTTVRTPADTAELRDAVAARDNANERIEAAVLNARARKVTWIEIAAALGVSPQAARQRYLPLVTH